MNNKVKKMAFIASFAALIVALQFFSNYVSFGPVSITLSLIPIVVGAILFGPSAGLFLGLVNGLIVIVAPSTLALFMPHNAFATVFLCLFKMGFAGWVSGMIFRYVSPKNFILAIILSAISVPIVNTGIFIIGTLVFFMPVIEQFAGEGVNTISYLFLTFIGINFIIEFLVNAGLSPAIISLVKIYDKQHGNSIFSKQ